MSQLDTNIYRNLVHGKDIQQIKSELNDINALKSEKNFKSIFSNIVAVELINNLLEKNGAQEDGFKGLFYLIHDVNQSNSSSFKGHIVPTMQVLISFYLFKEKSKHFRLNDNILKIAHLIAKNGNKDEITIFEKEIFQVIDFKKQELIGIIENIENNYLRSINQNGVVDWNIFESNKDSKMNLKFL